MEQSGMMGNGGDVDMKENLGWMLVEVSMDNMEE
jgi:hypothetical protein